MAKFEGTWFSVDVESNGPIIGRNQMMSFGAISIHQNLELGEAFWRNLNHDIAFADEETLKFWEQHAEAYNYTKSNCVDVYEAMYQFNEYIKRHKPPYCFVAKPTWYDYSWIRYHFLIAGLADPFEMKVMDYKQHAYALKIMISKKYKERNPMQHIAINDAVEQAGEFIEFMHLSERQKTYIRPLREKEKEKTKNV